MGGYEEVVVWWCSSLRCGCVIGNTTLLQSISQAHDARSTCHWPIATIVTLCLPHRWHTVGTPWVQYWCTIVTQALTPTPLSFFFSLSSLLSPLSSLLSPLCAVVTFVLASVQNYDDVEKLMNLGAAARTVAATNMNSTSSRAHTVFTVILTQQQKSPDTGKIMKKTSKINLVDLAGSERANATGATGDRLKEGCAINQSLSSLGNVINALAKQSEGGKGGKKKKKKKVMVPYRASKLTHLLKQSLGGNSKTIMIAAISPADVNFKETLGTLQYADRAKQIQNKAVVNEDPTEKLIRGLKEELEELKKQLKLQANSSSSDGGGSVGPGGRQRSSSLTEDEVAAIKMKFDQEKTIEMNSLREQMIENERLMKEQTKTWEERLKETKLAAEEQVKQLSRAGISVGAGDSGKDFEVLQEKKRTVPHLFNLNEDPLMSGVVVYFLDQRITRIGRLDSSNKHQQHICLSGLSIVSEHATITYDDHDLESSGNERTNDITIMPIGGTNAKVTVNGKKLVGSRSLHHNDRVIIGNNHVFRFVHPAELTLHTYTPILFQFYKSRS